MILITGGAGYIGCHINKLLNRQGYKTVVFDNLVYGHKEAVKWGIFELGDLNDKERLEEIFQHYPIDSVFHFAAYAYVGESVKEPSKYYRNNVANTLNLLDTMVKYKVKPIVFSSSCATYGIPEKIPIREDTDQRPINPYGATKLMVERVLQDYHRAYGLQYCSLRYFNAAGADPEGELGESHDPETHLIPLILKAAVGESEAIKVFGTDYNTRDGSCIRDYIHVMDLADAHIRAMNYLNQGGQSTCINLGNGSGYSVLEVIDTAQKVTGKRIRVELQERRPGDPAALVGSTDKASKVLGWRTIYPDIEDILSHAWGWECSRKY